MVRSMYQKTSGMFIRHLKMLLCKKQDETQDRSKNYWLHLTFFHHRTFFSLPKRHSCNHRAILFPMSTVNHYTHTAAWRGSGLLTPLRGLLSDWQMDNVQPLRNTTRLLLKHVHKEITRGNPRAIVLGHEGACCVVTLQAKCNEAVMCGLLRHLYLMTAQRCQCIATMNNWGVSWIWASWRIRRKCIYS